MSVKVNWKLKLNLNKNNVFFLKQTIVSMKIAVSDLIVRFMEGLGIKHIFGMPGAHILPVYDSLYHSNICCVLAKHEQGASFMAGGYARSSGTISACITTAGPTV